MKNEDRRVGLLIVIASLALIVIALIISDGWGYPTVPLFLFSPLEIGSIYYDPDFTWLRPAIEFFSLTRNVISLLIALFAYDVCRFFSLLPALINGKQETMGPEPQSESTTSLKSDA